MTRIIILLVGFVIAGSNSYSQKFDYHLDKAFRKMKGEWVRDSSTTKLFQKQIGVSSIQLFETDTVLRSYTTMLKKHMNDYGVNGYVSDEVSFRFLSYGQIVFESYKFKKEIIRHAYCGIFEMGGEDHFLMFTDLEDENTFKGLLFSYEYVKDALIIKHKELGVIGLTRK